MSSGENERADGVGRLLAGRYRVVAQLGRGGMGVVWRALDEVLGREVAVKELRTYTDAGGPELADLGRRMQREARAAARVRHPGVIAVHDVAEVDGRPLIVMELVDGPSLDDVLREEGPREPGEAAEIGAKVMDALAAAHGAGVLHRDVKPGNILLDRSGRVVLTDFGIATMEDPGDGATTHLTRSGELVGSLDYLAPERAQGHDFGPASDVWALGATLYAAVEGTSPFRRTSTWSTLTAIVSDPLPEPRGSGPLGPVLHELMQKQPEDRPDADRARELLEAVARTAGQDSATTNLRGPASKQREATERSVPAVPPGFGAPGSAGPGPAGPQPQDETTASDSGGGPRPRKARALLAAAAVTAVLAATGVTVGLLTNTDDSKNSARSSASQEAGDSPSSADPSRGTLTPSGDPDPTEQGDKETTPTPAPGKPERTEGADPTTKDPAPSPSATDDSGATGGNSGGTSGGGGGNNPAPVCSFIGDGKYNCEVWRTAASYTADGAEVGTLKAGTNYFYCQQNLGRRETYDEWTNIWWAKTDDDSGSKDVFISDVYIKGGDNDEPVPGLPVC
ncbi:serine/threonine-protein kinase [Streptomyces ureilyticus]|uniref:non-specific serine/threonine protein kinase n=1 Tax=Streptomyces ureilyticus TaxID=1775131 RepID=A0ABX0DMF9_9ACTN|nr:serine/threonine-protein kinase [Streptomyces ureilyticus]NGO41498.1 protein kinase [Streptomyces ureilyticus]